MRSRKRPPTVRSGSGREQLFRDVLPAVPNRSRAVTTFWPLAAYRHVPEQMLVGQRASPRCQVFLGPRALLAACLRCRLSKRRGRIANATRRDLPFFARRFSEARHQLLPGGQGKQSCRQGGNIQCRCLAKVQQPYALFYSFFISAEHWINETGQETVRHEFTGISLRPLRAGLLSLFLVSGPAPVIVGSDKKPFFVSCTIAQFVGFPMELFARPWSSRTKPMRTSSVSISVAPTFPCLERCSKNCLNRPSGKLSNMGSK